MNCRVKSKRVLKNWWWPLLLHWIIPEGCHVCVCNSSFDIVADIVVWNYQIRGWRFKRYCLRLHKCCIYIQDFSNLECKQSVLGKILQFCSAKTDNSAIWIPDQTIIESLFRDILYKWLLDIIWDKITGLGCWLSLSLCQLHLGIAGDNRDLVSMVLFYCTLIPEILIF